MCCSYFASSQPTEAREESLKNLTLVWNEWKRCKWRFFQQKKCQHESSVKAGDEKRITFTSCFACCRFLLDSHSLRCVLYYTHNKMIQQKSSFLYASQCCNSRNCCGTLSERTTTIFIPIGLDYFEVVALNLQHTLLYIT